MSSISSSTCASREIFVTRSAQTSPSLRAHAPPAANVIASVSVRTRSGAASASSCAIAPPIDTPSRWNESSSSASASASASRAMSAISYGPSAIDDRPTSRLSKITVRWPAEKAGTWSIQATVSAASPMTQSSGSPSPWTS